MIDLHAHIIPKVDDGASSYEEALQMLKKAESYGVEKIVATPHLYRTFSKFKNFQEIKDKFHKLKQLASNKNLKIEIFLGAEVYFTSEILDHLKNSPDFLTLNNSSYILIEFSNEFLPPKLNSIFFDIMTEGFIPIIAHPERNRVLQRHPKILYELVVEGALAQLNAGSLLGFYGELEKEAANIFIKHNLVHVIASDAHNGTDRFPDLDLLIKNLSRKIDEEKIQFLIHHIPESILKNEGVPDLGEYTLPKEKSLFHIFRRFKH